MAEAQEDATELWRGAEGSELNGEQQVARRRWMSGLTPYQRDEVLFELEVLLRGIWLFIDTRHHPGQVRGATSAGSEFRPVLQVIRDGLGQAVRLFRELLGSKENAYTFSSYLESLSTRDPGVHDAHTGEDAEQALYGLRNTLGSLLQVVEAILRQEHVPFRLYCALHHILLNELGRNPFVRPQQGFNVRPELDSLRQARISEALQRLEARSARRVVVLSLVVLFRAKRLLQLLRRCATQAVYPRHAHLIAAVLISEVRRLAQFLAAPAADALAQGYEQQLSNVHADQLDAEQELRLTRSAATLMVLRGTLRSAVLMVESELQAALQHRFPGLEAEAGEGSLATIDGLTVGVDVAIEKLIGTLHAGRAEVLRMETSVVAASWQREVWMFVRIAQVFLHQAEEYQGPSDAWGQASSVRFVHDFADYVRLLGYGLLRASHYPHVAEWLKLGRKLQHITMHQTDLLAAAVDECRRSLAHLQSWSASLPAETRLEPRQLAQQLQAYVSLRSRLALTA